MMTRYEFLRSLVGGGLGLGAAALALSACGTDGTGDPGEPVPDANTAVDAGNNNNPDAMQAPDAMNTCTTIAAAIGANHGHTMTVAAADLESATPKMYEIQGASAHPHTVTITPAQFAMLKANGTLTVTSSTNAGHPHTVVVTC